MADKTEYKSMAADHLNPPKAPITGSGDKCEVHWTAPTGYKGHGQPQSRASAQDVATQANAEKKGVFHTVKCTP